MEIFNCIKKWNDGVKQRGKKKGRLKGIIPSGYKSSRQLSKNRMNKADMDEVQRKSSMQHSGEPDDQLPLLVLPH